MDFREAMDTVGVGPRELAEVMGVSLQAVKQARLDPGSPGHRPPPAGWEEVLVQLAQERCVKLKRVVGLTREG